jgi:uncharacterized protein (TIGR00369 family)
MTLPPYAKSLGMTLAEEDGRPTVVMSFADAVLGRPGFLHGGAIAGLLEVAARVALDAALAVSGASAAPITVTTDYRRGGRDAPTRARGRVTRLGTRVASVEAIAWQDDADRPIATAQATYRLTRD